MNRCLTAFVTSVCLVALAGCATTEDGRHAQAGANAQIFDAMDAHERPVTISTPEAQLYFNQGLTWMYAFNHDEAIRSFAHAAGLDPECAMAWWGVALCEGPNYNDPVMTPQRTAAAWSALQKAIARIDNTNRVERALITALSFRYAEAWTEDRSDLDAAFADAMAGVWAAYPDDADIGALYAESMMVQMPWKLYTLDKTPAENTPEIVAVLERVMEMEPYHPAANHLYIHAVEPSADPDRGLVAADRLSDLVPVSGHLLHMPSHIHVKTGRWDEAIVQNQKAMRADALYRSMSPDQAIQHLYMVHNSHMLAYAAMMSGREREAMAAARAMWANIPDDALRAVGPFFDKWMCSVYDVQKRFGRWDEILAEPAPPSFLPITTAVWHAHRAIAYAAKKDFDNAESEQEAFRKVMGSLPPDLMSGTDAALRILEVSDYFIEGEIALQKGEWDEAARALTRGAEVEDSLTYGEPPQWLQPIRHTLGAVYLKSGRYEDAERVYREDLDTWRNNGWSLYGLSRALELQGRLREAADVERRYQIAWAGADEPTTTSCKCIP